MANDGLPGWEVGMSLFLGAVGLFVAVAGKKARGLKLFGVGFWLAYSLALSIALPNLFHEPVGGGGPHKHTPLEVLGQLLAVFTGLAGGGLALIWMEVALGLALACGAMVVLLLVLGGSVFAHSVLAIVVSVLFALAAIYGFVFALTHKETATFVVTVSLGSLLVVCAGEGAHAQSSLLKDLTALCTRRWHQLGGTHSYSSWWMLLCWVVVAAVAAFCQAYLNGEEDFTQLLNALRLRRDRHMYQAVPDGQAPSAQAQAPQGAPEHKRQDSNIFQQPMTGTNVMTLRLPADEGQEGDEEEAGADGRDPEETALLHILSGMFEDLSAVFGFQLHNGFNQTEHLVILLMNQKRYEQEAYQRLIPAGAPPVPGAENGGGPVEILHAKMFRNYKKWAAALNVEPVFVTHPDYVLRQSASPMPGAAPVSQKWYETASAKKKLHNLLLQLLIWGEAGNLRHMPECLAWLYHTCAEHFVACCGKDLQPVGDLFFLNKAIAPVHALIKKEMGKVGKNGVDHDTCRNYDDFNEFFWKPECLRHSWVPPAEAVVRVDGKQLEPVADGLKQVPKTFMEKRSWLQVLLAFQRILDFHVVSFHLLAMLGFWEVLQWDLPYACQLLSTVFLAMNFMGIFWAVLEVCATVQDDAKGGPAFQVKLEAKCGLAFRLATRVMFLYYQVYFFGLSLADGGLDLLPEQRLTDKAVQLHNWWQYVWVSLVLLAVWFVECAFQVVPRLSSWVFETRNPYFKALLDIVFPQSRNYTGKRVQEPERKVLVYMVFWFFVLGVKLWFSYNFEVGPLALPALELSDDLINIPGGSVLLTCGLIVARWLPFVAIYLLDTVIWYAIAAGTIGLLVGLDEKLGLVHDFASIRSNFMKTPEGFFSRLIFDAGDTRPKRGRKASAVAELGMPRKATSSSRTNLLGAAATGFASVDERQPLIASSAAAAAAQQTLASRLTGALNASRNYHSMSSGEAYFDVALHKWSKFAEVWNDVVNILRETDVISNAEQEMLVFHFFEDLSRPIYLPVFQTAGIVEKATRIIEEKGKQFRSLTETQTDGTGNEESRLKAREAVARQLWAMFEADKTMTEALSETMELGIDIIERMLGEAHAADVRTAKNVVTEMQGGIYLDPPAGGGDEEQGGAHVRSTRQTLLLEVVKVEQVGKALAALGKLVAALKGGLAGRKIDRKREKPAKVVVAPRVTGGMVRVGSAMKKSRSAGFLSSLSSQDLASADPSAGGQGALDVDPLRDKVRDTAREFLTACKGMILAGTSFTNVSEAILNILNGAFFWDNYYASEALDALAAPETMERMQGVLAKLHGLLTLHVSKAEPESAEAKRRLSFFVNSLFMDVPKAPSIQNMMSWTVMTPFYSEDVMYNRKDLEKENTDGISTLLYLRTLYKKDWKNFQERLGLRDDSNLWGAGSKVKEELRLWASMRAQTLSRTVHGMMYYEKALQMLSTLDRDPALVAASPSSTGKGSHIDSEEQIKRKFGYVVSCQVYGRLKKEQDPKADDIEFLLRRFPNLRVAYIDEKPIKGSTEKTFASVLIRGHPSGTGVEEIFRVQLPGNPILGEGKPENQNHAIIFTRGEHVQAIDMNQEGYYEDAFKMRNFLQEFASTGDEEVPTTILGFREHIFTGGVSSLANYMALQEYSFVTLGQRVLNRPLRMRLHYGHPDVFDKLFFMQNGGISKASKGINLSEDIFAGYNNVLRGGAVEFKEYVQVGKGRDVGMGQIYKFEAKLSQGAAEQSISRDVSRMLNRVDFFRLLTFYFGGIGHYLSSVLTVTAIWLMVYLMLGLALFQHEKIGDRPIVPEGTLQIVLAGVGLLQTVPLFCTLVLEKGVWASLREVLMMFTSGGPLYFIFHIRTRDYYYTQTILAGGASYKATGRGFVTHHETFAETFRCFGPSHFYLGFEVLMALVLLACYSDTPQYIGRTWSLWIAAFAFLFAPFWFNPMSMEWAHVSSDYTKWMSWMRTTSGGDDTSWDTWWKETNGYVTDFSLLSKLYLVARNSIFVLMGLGLLYKPLWLDAKGDDWHSLLWHLLAMGGLFVVSHVLTISLAQDTTHQHYASGMIAQYILGVGIIFIVCSSILAHPISFIFLLALYYMVGWVATILFAFGFQQVRHLHRMHDYVLGHVLFVPLFLCAALQFPQHIQTWLLYQNALAKGVVFDDLLQKTRESNRQEGGRVEVVVTSPPVGSPSSAFLLSPRLSPSAVAQQKISPEEKPAERIFAELEEATGGGGASQPPSKKKGAKGTKQQQQQRKEAQQQAQETSPASEAASPEGFEFRQPTHFPQRG